MDKSPYFAVSSSSRECLAGWPAIRERIGAARVVAVECYPGVNEDGVARELGVGRTVVTTSLRPEAERLIAPFLTDDPVFGRMCDLEIEDLIDASRLAVPPGPALIVGQGAALADADILVYADLPRWEIQQRQRRGPSPAAAYKRGFFVEWRIADRWKARLLPRIDFLLDTVGTTPKAIAGNTFRSALAAVARRPFRTVPFFDPGPWGGQWMRRVCGLPDGPPNYAWCFNCVPEENSLLLGFGDARVEIPAIDVVLAHPRELLGDRVYRRFGAEFPIRFDFLDTMGGGNLSLQVHPLTEHIRDRFGMAYTQDESYYILDAEEDASVYLGLREGIDRDRMVAALRSGAPFPVEEFVNRWPARKHDHFSIPAGTIHCSGRNSLVLEISATPYIFTFKLWDWGRMGLDGRPRPLHLDHGIANIQWDRTTAWVRDNLLPRAEPVEEGPCFREERTGLHALEFIETRRHWFRGPVRHSTGGTVNVLNLVEGEAIAVESPDGAFDAMTIRYPETFIVPAAVGDYVIRPLSGECATVKAYVR